MERFWKWLLRTDAKAPFLIALALFLIVAGWRAWVDFSPKTEAPAPVAGKRPPPTLEPVQGLGVLGYVSNQLAAEALIIPVNPFRPTFEAMVRSQLDKTPPTRPPVAVPEANDTTKPNPFAHLNPNQTRPPRDPRNPNRGERPPVAPAVPALTFRGVFQRPDGRYAALLHDNTIPGNTFVAAGATIHGITVVAADMERIQLQLPGGEIRELPLGGNVTLSGAAP